jgi:hypothetical protein
MLQGVFTLFCWGCVSAAYSSSCHNCGSCCLAGSSFEVCRQLLINLAAALPAHMLNSPASLSLVYRPSHSLTAVTQQVPPQQHCGARRTQTSFSGHQQHQAARLLPSGAGWQLIWLLLLCACLCSRTSCCGRAMCSCRSSAGRWIGEVAAGPCS